MNVSLTKVVTAGRPLVRKNLNRSARFCGGGHLKVAGTSVAILKRIQQYAGDETPQ
jgi:hypothetical protein